MAITTTDAALLRLLQLSSAALPIGGYSFSQGLEYAIEEQWLKNGDDVAQWLSFQLNEALTHVDLPLLQRQISTLRVGDLDSFNYWNAYALACRETAELRLTDTAMGAALVKLLGNLSISMPFDQEDSGQLQEITYITAFAVAASHWQLETRLACHGYLWSWLENQVAAATKLVPLGQTKAQQLLGQLMEQIPGAINRAEEINDDSIGSSLPALAMASAWHETQYTRLFRS